jgi:hypothetical protein
LQDRLQSSAELAAQNVPFFLETGQNLSLQIASDARFQDPAADVTAIISDRIRSVPFFNQLVVLDLGTNTVIAAHPADPAFQITRPEEDGLALIALGVPIRYIWSHRWRQWRNGASFLAAILNALTRIDRRTYLSSNPIHVH